MTTTLWGDLPDFIETEEDNPLVVDGVFDFESNLSPFILSTKKIEIPEYPNSFNPSIVRWQGKLLMSFRIRDEDLAHAVGLVWVDEEMNPISRPTRLQVDASSDSSKLQDPRFITVGETLYVVFSDHIQGKNHQEIRRVFVGEIEYKEGAFFLINAKPLTSYENKIEDRTEKNWTPFIYDDQLLLSYTISPHCVFLPYMQEGHCDTLCLCDQQIPWDFGELRGGTQALKEDNFYLGFFHSVKKVASVQSNKKMMIHYFMGAFTFEPNPPFTIKAVSEWPILGENFYTKTDFKTWKPLKVVFPGGFISNPDHLWLVYGKQDSEIWAAKIDKKKLLESLVSINLFKH